MNMTYQIRIMTALCLSLALLVSAKPIFAKDLGVKGEVYDIIEEPIFDMIRKRLADAQEDGTLDRINEEFRERVKKSIERPQPVKGVSVATEYKAWNYDPTVYAEEDYKDANGLVVVKKGTSFNPLQFVGMRDKMYFINSDVDGQLEWAFEKLDSAGGYGKIILVEGAPLEVMRESGRRVYFDQKGALSAQFGITAVPSLISQDGNMLKVEEIPLNGSVEAK